MPEIIMYELQLVIIYNLIDGDNYTCYMVTSTKKIKLIILKLLQRDYKDPCEGINYLMVRLEGNCQP